MSLLLKALQRASKSREELSTGIELEPRGASRGTTGGLGAADALPGVRGRAGAAGRASGDDLSEVLASASANAALARNEGFAFGEWIRENPIYAFGIAVVVFLVFYFAYVFLAINYPGLLNRKTLFASGAPAPTAVPSPPPAPAAPPVSAPVEAPPAPMPTLEVQPAPRESGPAVPSAPETAAAATPPPQSPALKLKPAETLAASTPLPAPAPERTAPPVRAPEPESGPSTRRPLRPAPTTPAAATPAASTSPTPAPPTDRVQVRPTDAGSRIGQQIDEAYAALQTGDLTKARALYGEVLARDNRNLDALLGAGTTAWRSGDTEKASDHYYRVLELDPQNASAQAALIGMVGRVDPIAAETRLKQLIAREPSGFLYATLGHVYAEQGQWSGAQQAYFQAFQSDPANPDYAYNLAVGLERVGQPKIAAGYYRQALDLARTRGASGFDRKIAQQRLEKLGAAVE